MTAQQAYCMWKIDPENVKMLDVRTLEEYIFFGHPDTFINNPLMFSNESANGFPTVMMPLMQTQRTSMPGVVSNPNNT